MFQLADSISHLKPEVDYQFLIRVLQFGHFGVLKIEFVCVYGVLEVGCLLDSPTPDLFPHQQARTQPEFTEIPVTGAQHS